MQNIFQLEALWRLRFIQGVLFLGRVFYRQGMSLVKVLFGEWGMESPLKSRSIVGCRTFQIVELFLCGIPLMLFL